MESATTGLGRRLSVIRLVSLASSPGTIGRRGAALRKRTPRSESECPPHAPPPSRRSPFFSRPRPSLPTSLPGKVPDGRDRPSVLLILPDQLRGQALGCMGNPDVRTPNLDRLASQGVLFRNTFANTPVCCPARADPPDGQVRPQERHGRQRPAAAGVGDHARRDPRRRRLPHRLHRQVAPRRRPAAARLRPARTPPAGLRLLGGQRVRAIATSGPPTSGTPTSPITEDRFEPEVWTDRAIEFLQAGRGRAVLPRRRRWGRRTTPTAPPRSS